VLILALDTTTPAGSVAITRDDKVIAVRVGDPARTHGERLPGEIEDALNDAAVMASDLELLAVASGPGGFTGLRIGLATMQGLAMVLDTPVVGVSALDALAAVAWPTVEDPKDTHLFAWMDAQRSEVFAAEYVRALEDSPFAWRLQGEPTVGAPAQLLEGVETGARYVFVGDGAVRYRSQIEQLQASHRVIEPPDALAPAIASLGRQLAARGLAGPPHALRPLYVRRPDAVIERLRHGGS